MRSATANPPPTPASTTADEPANLPSPTPTVRADGRRHLPWLLLQLVVGLALVWAAAGRPINHDCAAILMFSQELAEGRLPYVDFVDVNPPLAYYWGTVPVFVAKATGWPLVAVFQVLVGLFVVASLLELQYVLRRGRLGLTPAELGAVGLAWVFASWFVLRVGDFGQREHLFVLAYVPYLAGRALRYDGGRLPATVAALLGAQAALGAFFKPQFLAAAGAVELVFLVMHRTPRHLWRPETVAFVAVGAAYALHWAVVPAAMRLEFFGRWVPMFLGRYGAYGSASLALHVERALVADLRYVTPAAVAGTLLAAALAVPRRTALRTPLAGLATLALLSAAGYVQQYKAWVYHVWPFALAGWMAAAFVLVQAQRSAAGWAARRRRRQAGTATTTTGGVVGGQAADGRMTWPARLFAGVALAAGLVGAWPVVASAVAARVPPPPDRTPLVLAMDRHTRPGDAVMVVSSSILDAYPMLLQAGRRSGTRYTCMFPMAMTYWDPARVPFEGSPPYRLPDRAPADEREFLEELAADLRIRKPKLIAVWAWPGCQGCPLDFNVYDYLAFNGFVEQEILPGYAPAGQDGPYRFFVPRPPAPPPPKPPPPPAAQQSPPRRL